MAERETLTVRRLCQNVSTDGVPVNQHGEEYGRGWRQMLTWETKRLRTAQFCPKDVARVSTATISGEYAHRFRNWRWVITVPIVGDKELLCRCHKKPHLVFKRERKAEAPRG